MELRFSNVAQQQLINLVDERNRLIMTPYENPDQFAEKLNRTHDIEYEISGIVASVVYEAQAREQEKKA